MADTNNTEVIVKDGHLQGTLNLPLLATPEPSSTGKTVHLIKPGTKIPVVVNGKVGNLVLQFYAKPDA